MIFSVWSDPGSGAKCFGASCTLSSSFRSLRAWARNLPVGSYTGQPNSLPTCWRRAYCPTASFRTGRSSTACRSFGWFGSPTEEVIYQAYCAARLRALTGSTWATVALVSFWWAFQHSVFPLIFDWRLIVFRFLQFLPLVAVFQLIYLRTRRLPRMIVMHWPMDLFAALLTLRM